MQWQTNKYYRTSNGTREQHMLSGMQKVFFIAATILNKIESLTTSLGPGCLDLQIPFTHAGLSHCNLCHTSHRNFLLKKSQGINSLQEILTSWPVGRVGQRGGNLKSRTFCERESQQMHWFTITLEINDWGLRVFIVSKTSFVALISFSWIYFWATNTAGTGIFKV